MPAVNGEENMDVSWISLCQTWEYLKAQFVYEPKFSALGKWLL